MAWQDNTRPFTGHELSFRDDIDDDRYYAELYDQCGLGDNMTEEQLNSIAQRVNELANVIITHVGPEHLHIVAKAPAPFETITKLTDGVRTVEVTVATPVPADAGERFRENRHLRQMFDREGKPANEGEAKLFAANLGITTPPILAAIHGDKLGVLFASIEDAQAYDRAKVGAA